MSPRYEDEVFVDTAACFDKCPLKKLRVSWLCIDTFDVMTFLLKHASTLKAVDIDHGKTESREDASDSLSELRESTLQLEHLGFCELRIIHDRSDDVHGNKWSAQYDSAETIASALIEIADRPEVEVDGAVDILKG